MWFFDLRLQVCTAGRQQGRAFAGRPGCMPGSLQTVSSNCEVDDSSIRSLQVRTPEAQRDEAAGPSLSLQ